VTFGEYFAGVHRGVPSAQARSPHPKEVCIVHKISANWFDDPGAREA
jgi:hypothetical protein